MQAHPVPQNITGFEFKLIGFLTIRQFGYLAAAGIGSFVIYLLPLPFGIIKFLLILILMPLGAALAFLPINDLPFDRWLVAFIRSVYAPTKRVWRKEPVVIGFLAPEFSVYLQHQKAPAQAARSDRAKIDSYLSSHQHGGPSSMLDIEEAKKLASLNQSLSALLTATTNQKTNSEQPNQIGVAIGSGIKEGAQ